MKTLPAAASSPQEIATAPARHTAAPATAIAGPSHTFKQEACCAARQAAPGWRFYALVFAASWLVYAAVGWPHTHPPYMDAFYYVDIARNLAHGQGLSEGFVWNYLAGLPPLRHPSSTYWLPGLSLLLAPLWALGLGYRGATLATAALAALCPALAAGIGRDLFGTRRHALTMAGLTLFNGVWFHDWASPDAFVPFALLATLAFLLTYKGLQGRAYAYPLAGLTAGLAALMRQEGVLLLGAMLLSAALTPTARRRLWPRGLLGAVALYGLVQAPWWLHNLAVWGTPIAAGGSRTLWMRSYDAFYSLHTEALTPGNYLAWGLAHIVAAKVAALWLTLAVWAALWLVVLVPPLLVGAWRLRRRVECRPFLLYWGLLAVAMPLLFTSTLEHGTLAHASGALVPFGSACIVAGLDACGGMLARLRGGNGARLARDMSIIAVGLAAVVSVGMTMQTFPAHGDELTRDAAVATWLHQHNRTGAPVIVLDPPAFSYLDDGAYVVAPSDGLAAVRTVARRYGARYWALDPLHAPAQDALYHGRLHLLWLRREAVVDGVQIYQLHPNAPKE